MIRYLIAILLFAHLAHAEEVVLTPSDGEPGEVENKFFTQVQKHDFSGALATLAGPFRANIRYREGETPLGIAVTASNRPLVEKLLEKGAKIEFEARATYFAIGTPLTIACLAGNLDMIELLVKKGASVRGSPYLGVTSPLGMTIAMKKIDVLRYFLDHGVSPNEIFWSSLFETELHAAVDSGDVAAVTLLLERGARVNEVDERGRTPLALAVEKNATEIAELLKKKGGVAKLDARALAQTTFEKNRRFCVGDAATTRAFGEKLDRVYGTVCRQATKESCDISAQPINGECAAAPLIRKAMEVFNGECPYFRFTGNCASYRFEARCRCGKDFDIGVKRSFSCSARAKAPRCEPSKI